MQTGPRSSITGISSIPTQGTLLPVRPMGRAFSASGSWPPPIWLCKALDRQAAVTGIRTLQSKGREFGIITFFAHFFPLSDRRSIQHGSSRTFETKVRDDPCWIDSTTIRRRSLNTRATGAERRNHGTQHATIETLYQSSFLFA